MNLLMSFIFFLAGSFLVLLYIHDRKQGYYNKITLFSGAMFLVGALGFALLAVGII